MEQTDYLIALTQIHGLGRVRLTRLLERYPDTKTVWNLPASAWEELDISKTVINYWQDAKYKDVLGVTERLLMKGIKTTALSNEDYPALLKQSIDPPILLYYQGSLGCLKRRSIAVVGSRKVTSYGKSVTEHFVSCFADIGITVISGLALGVDTIAHQIILDNGGQTVAVLGGGLNHIFPIENEQLAKEILEKGGAIMSEYPPNMNPMSGLFPARNRIIAGLAEAVLVTEAALGSGSLITAKEALDYGREVFAVPGSIITQSSLGCLLLIKQGAKLVSRIEDILEVLNVSPISDHQIEALELSELEEQILKILRLEQKHIDELIQETGVSLSNLASVLLKLELRGVISNLSPGMYIATMKT